MQRLHNLGSLVHIRGSNGTANGDKHTTLGDVYKLDPVPLGEGRYSLVYGVTHKVTRARRAVKTAKKESHSRFLNLGAECPGRLARHEAHILRNLDHPNVVRIYEAYEEEGAVHLVLELCEGGDVLERILNTNKRLPEPENAALFTQMLFAVWHLHMNGVVHRDLKPEHFMFSQREPSREPLPPEVAAMKLIDFGLSHWTGSSFAPEGGTPLFMPPEAKAGKPSMELAHRADMWALGVTLHTMLVGHYPAKNLTDAAQAQYFAKPAWNGISRVAIDLLGQLLRQGASNRPTALEALKHPWTSHAVSTRCMPPEPLLRLVNEAAEYYAKADELRKVALMAVSREVDASDACNIRRLLQTLLIRCEGPLTKEALIRLKHCEAPLSEAVAAIEKNFTGFDGAQTGNLVWTEFLAAMLDTSNILEEAESHQKVGGSSLIPPLHEDACFRAFDVLSSGKEAVSTETLGRLLAPTQEGDPIDKLDSGETIATTLRTLLRDVGGSLSKEDYKRLLRGEKLAPKQRLNRNAAGGGGFGTSFLRFIQCGRSSGSRPTAPPPAPDHL